MISHCAEAYWTNMMKASGAVDNEFDELLAANPYNPAEPALYKESSLCRAAKAAFEKGEKTFKAKRPHGRPTVTVTFEIPKDIWNGYVNDIFTKTVCEAKNLARLKKAEELAKEQGLAEGLDYGYINDRCLTDLTPENEDGTTTVGIWFRPLPDETAHKISRKFQLYRD